MARTTALGRDGEHGRRHPAHGDGDDAPVVGQGRDRLDRVATTVKPRLRGWLHAGMTPLVFVAALVLVVFGPTLTSRVAAAVYLLCSLMLFGTSATYHRGHWSARVAGVFRRWDHANIYLFIAGTYTPLAANLLHGHSRVLLLSLVWGAASVGIAFRILWLGAPRWLYTALYVLMGWAAVGWLGDFWHAGGPAVVILVIAGGLVYSLGAVVYALKRPNPSPQWFGFHEIFHSATVIAAVLHYIAIALVTLG